jgi:hypothetical protein
MTSQPFTESLAALRRLAGERGMLVKVVQQGIEFFLQLDLSAPIAGFSRIEDALAWVMKQPEVGK